MAGTRQDHEATLVRTERGQVSSIPSGMGCDGCADARANGRQVDTGWHRRLLICAICKPNVEDLRGAEQAGHGPWRWMDKPTATRLGLLFTHGTRTRPVRRRKGAPRATSDGEWHACLAPRLTSLPVVLGYI